jgi:hypothetical protein
MKWPTPTQDAADALLIKIWQSRVASHRKAIRAMQAMERWHNDPRSEGRIVEATSSPVVTVLPIRRRAHR